MIQSRSAAGGEDVVKDAMPFVCILSLGANVDVDPVNGSYSLDDVVIVNHPSPNDNDNDDDDDDDNGDGNGGWFSTLPLLPVLTFIIIGSGGMPSSTRRIISTSLLLREFARSSSTTASADGNLMTISSYTALGTNEPPLPSPATNDLLPICPADKPKQRHWISNVFINDRGFPDESDHYDNLLHNVEGRPILQKLKHPLPPLDEVDPKFFSAYDESKHDKQLQRDLELSHLDTQVQEKIYALVKKYWSVFNKKGIYVPVENYECVIDTGDALPIAITKILYGPWEILIMHECIAALEKVGHIQQIFDGRWFFKALLAAKPHQEHVCNIAKFIWRFCVNYIPLNSITRIIVYPIPLCDLAINEEFRMGQFYWFFDAPMGYHQLAVALDSQEMLAFQGPDAIKWTYTVMPFGPTNGPAMFINFIHDNNSQWQALAQSLGTVINDDTNTKTIFDDIFSWAKFLDILVVHGMPTAGLSILPTFIELAEKPHLPKAF
jgi:hypothetical protein